MGEKKRVRMLLRVSSNQQLEEDGDLGIQRQLVKEFIAQHEEWHLDSKEYFEGSNSGYSNAVENRDILQHCEMHKETSMIFLQSIRMTESVEECGRLVHMLCSLKAMVWIYTR